MSCQISFREAWELGRFLLYLKLNFSYQSKACLWHLTWKSILPFLLTVEEFFKFFLNPYFNPTAWTQTANKTKQVSSCGKD